MRKMIKNFVNLVFSLCWTSKASLPLQIKTSFYKPVFVIFFTHLCEKYNKASLPLLIKTFFLPCPLALLIKTKFLLAKGK